MHCLRGAPPIEPRQVCPAFRRFTPLGHEHDALAWVPLAELTQRPILEPIKPILKTLLERKESYV
jgi:hypothetical protein